MSMTTSLSNAIRKSNASRATRTHASGSSPFTWKIGAGIIRATSVEYTDERDDAGAVVKPTWLLMTTCTVPPVRYPRSCDRLSVSATTPCPAKAASPCRSTGSTEKKALPRFRRSCLARTMPSSTGLAASGWEGGGGWGWVWGGWGGWGVGVWLGGWWGWWVWGGLWVLWLWGWLLVCW